MRQQVLSLHLSGFDLSDNVSNPNAEWLIPQRHNKTFPCARTCKNWIKLYEAEGHVNPKVHTGNKESTREINGEDLVNLALYRLVRPEAYLSEVKAYIHNRNPGNLPYSDSQIVRAEQRIGLSRKVASTTSDCAYLPINLQKRENYWSLPYPHGIAGEETRDIIDIDECCLKLESINRKYGKVTRDRRCTKRGKFKKGEGRMSLIMGICGDGSVDDFFFHKTYTQGGTDTGRFYLFMAEFIAYLETRFPGRKFLFTMDNLNIHKVALILNLIHENGHRVVYRAPYWSCDGPIEYVFNTLQTRIQMSFSTIDSLDDLVDEVDLVVKELGPFTSYFVHVGFPEPKNESDDEESED
jgi:hypothetical protein